MVKVPDRINDLLIKDVAIHSLVLNVIKVISPWISDNKTVFFPEYTDHGQLHLEEVLLTADSIISDESWKHLTPKDAAVLIVAVLLHDCALHLSEDGFFCLIKNENVVKSKYMDAEVGWPTLWADFLAEASRFDQKKLQSLFDSVEPVGSFPKNKIDFTLRHRLLVGEFLRRHHARLAHEIAIVGIPGVAGYVEIGSSEFSEFLDLSGYVARSHNFSIRHAVDALATQQKRVHLNCHVPFLMVILRISDYVQIQASRAHGQLLLLKGLVSPISRGEWKKHSAIKDINQAHEDPESIYVECDPESSSIFLGLQRLMRDIQSELDQSWSVMGEVYGRFKPLDELGITIRRIRSNLDNLDIFVQANRPKYIPRQFKFRTANSELIDLLIGPLYGDKPEIGIRELVQNSIDACLERDSYFERINSRYTNKTSSDVVVTLNIPEEGVPRVIIEDHGVGMTLSIVEGYFLNVGASFRYSDAWRQLHKIGGRSTIHRSGRFGIGVLAAFLLGKEVRVTTRHISLLESAGLTFSCTQGDSEIEIQSCNFHHGTKIEIEITSEVARYLLDEDCKWDWYCLAYPRVERLVVQGNQKLLDQSIEVPSCNDSIDVTIWNRIESNLYDDVLWSHSRISKRNNYPSRAIVCNGIFVTESVCQLNFEISPGLSLIRAGIPTIVVFDPDGKFPINLQRNELANGDVGFNNELQSDVSMRFAESLMPKLMKVSSKIGADSIGKLFELSYFGSEYFNGYSVNTICPYFFVGGGIVPADFELISKLRITSIVVDGLNVNNGDGAYLSSKFKDWFEAYIPIKGATNSNNSKIGFIKDSIGSFDYKGEPNGFLASLPICGRRAFIRKSDIESLTGSGRVPKSYINKFEVEFEIGSWVILKVGNVTEFEFEFDLEGMIAELDSVKAFGFFVFYLDWDSDFVDIKTSFAKSWMKIVPSVIFNPQLIE